MSHQSIARKIAGVSIVADFPVTYGEARTKLVQFLNDHHNIVLEKRVPTKQDLEEAVYEAGEPEYLYVTADGSDIGWSLVDCLY